MATNDHGFDRETVPQFLVTVEARDELGKGSRNTIQLEVILDDVNDNPPLFDLAVYEARLRENDLCKYPIVFISIFKSIFNGDLQYNERESNLIPISFNISHNS